MKVLQVLVIVAVGVLGVSGCPGGSREAVRFEESSSSGPKRLIKTSAELPGQWLDEDQIGQLVSKHVNFVDVTDYPNLKEVNPADVNTKDIPSSVEFATTVRPMLNLLQTSRIDAFIREFSSYHTRYYTSATGLQSQKWLLAQVQAAAQGYAGTAEVEEFTHIFQQSSIIARIVGSDPQLRSQVVILGAHQDSVNTAGSTLNAPGADDNGSGSAILLETLRVIVESGFIPKRTIELQWYAAEEVGLRGSAAIAENYKSTGVDVVGMINYDVSGYYSAGIEDIGIYTDNTNGVLNDFLRLLVETYCEWGWRNRTCGYGCSDHASWTSRGFPAAMPAEVVLHPQMHSTRDNIDTMSVPQVQQFAKLAVGFVVEMSLSTQVRS